MGFLREGVGEGGLEVGGELGVTAGLHVEGRNFWIIFFMLPQNRSIF